MRGQQNKIPTADEGRIGIGVNMPAIANCLSLCLARQFGPDSATPCHDCQIARRFVGKKLSDVARII